MKTIAIGVVWLLWLASPQSAQPITKYDRGAALAMLKQVKADLKENYYDRDFRGIDVEQTFQRAEDRLKGAATLAQAIGTIADVVMRFDDSHTVFIPPDRKARVLYGWRCEMVGDVPYVTAVAAGSDAEKQGVEVGDRVLAWNEYAPTRENLLKIHYVYNFVRPQRTQRIVLRKADGAVKTLDVETRLEKRDQYDLPDLLASLFNAFEGGEDRHTMVGDVLVWHYADFGEVRNIDAVMKNARNARGLVLDLRGNSGGAADALRAMVSWLFDRTVNVGVERTRKGDKPIDAKGRRDAFAGRLIVLVDSGSASSSEMAARIVQIERRGTVMGDRTAGAVMTGRFIPHLYGDDKLAFYATMITIGDVRMSDGNSLEHAGVTPDEIALPSAADLAAGRDPVLARAIEKLGGTITPEKAGRLFKEPQK